MFGDATVRNTSEEKSIQTTLKEALRVQFMLLGSYLMKIVMMALGCCLWTRLMLLILLVDPQHDGMQEYYGQDVLVSSLTLTEVLHF